CQRHGNWSQLTF
nr:immunoglobulin light chain junction region [Macaca mulatta]